MAATSFPPPAQPSLPPERLLSIHRAIFRRVKEEHQPTSRYVLADRIMENMRKAKEIAQWCRRVGRKDHEKAHQLQQQIAADLARLCAMDPADEWEKPKASN